MTRHLFVTVLVLGLSAFSCRQAPPTSEEFPAGGQKTSTGASVPVAKPPNPGQNKKKDLADQNGDRVLRSEILNVAMGGHEVGTLEIRDERLDGILVHTRKSDLAIKRGELTLKLKAEGVSRATLTGVPISFRHVRSGASGDATATGIVKDGNLVVTTEQAGAKTQKSFPLEGLVLAASLEHRARNAEPDEAFTQRAYVEELGAVVDMKVSVAAAGMGKKVTTQIKTLETVEHFNSEGALLISRTPALGSLAYPKGMAPPDEIKAGSVDVLAKSVWPAPALSKDEKRVVYRVQTPDAQIFAVPEDLRQEVIARTKTHVDIAVVGGRSTNDVLGEAELKTYLEETAYEPVRDPRIVAAAKKYSAGSTTTKAKITQLVNFVHDHVDDKALDRGYAAAPLTLESKRGDCTEHSVLLSALLRAIKIPTRLVDGVVLTGGHVGYHEWVEVYVEGEGFIPADPTFGEFPAPPLRLKLAEGASSPEGLLELGVAAGRLLRPGVKVMVLSPQ